MGLTIGVRFIKDDKSKRAVIIIEIRGRNTYLGGTTKFRTNKRLKEGGATGSKTCGSYARDERRDKLTTKDEIRMEDQDEHAID